MTTIKEAMEALPKTREEYYKSLAGYKVASIETAPCGPHVTVRMVLTRQCKDGTLDHRLEFQVNTRPISWTIEAKDDKKRSSS